MPMIQQVLYLEEKSGHRVSYKVNTLYYKKRDTANKPAGQTPVCYFCTGCLDGRWHWGTLVIEACHGKLETGVTTNGQWYAFKFFYKNITDWEKLVN